MNYLIFFAMSLLSLLFGCRTKESPVKSPEWPRFPATDQSAAKVVPVHLEDGYWPKCFFIPADKQSVYVLGHGKIVSTTMQDGEETRPDLRDRANYRLYALDTKGQITHRLNLPSQDVRVSARFGLVDGQTILWFNEQFLVLDTRKFVIQEKIPVYDEQHFPSRQNIELMTPDEQRDAYLKKLETILEKPASCRWLEWKPGNGYFVFVQGPAGKRSAWAPIGREDDVLADLKSRLEPMVVLDNPGANNYADGANFLCADGPVQIREAEYRSAGTELDYPNYKSRMVLQYEMTVGHKTLHFSTTDKSRHNLRLDFSDNLMLATSDGAAWVAYEGILYRVE